MLLADVGGVTAEAGHEVVVIRPPEAAPAGAPALGEVPEPAGTNGDEGAEGSGDVAEEQAATEPEAAPPPFVPQWPGEVPGSEVFRVSLRELRSGNPDQDLTLKEGDTVYVPRAANIYVTGYVARPGAIRYEEGITVFQALTRAGGPTERGSSKVRIVRLIDGKRKEIKAEMTDVLLPEDTVKVPERFF
jgi:polysaccharide export outer membrane protein